MEEKAKAKLKANTGRTLEQWVALARKAKIAKEAALRAWLADEHGIKSRIGYWIASMALAEEQLDYGDPESLVDALYSGERAALRALHERLVDEFLGLGDDVLVTSCKTMVPVYRKFVFAELKPARGGVEVQLALGATPAGKRLRKAKRMADDRITHAVLVDHEDAIDAELRNWLAAAYDAGAKRVERSADFEVPMELAAGLKRSKTAAKTWSECTPAMQRAFVTWISDARQEETRKKRVATSLERLAAGKKKTY